MRSWQVGNPWFSKGILQGAGLGMRLLMKSGERNGFLSMGEMLQLRKGSLAFKTGSTQVVGNVRDFVSGTLGIPGSDKIFIFTICLELSHRSWAGPVLGEPILQSAPQGHCSAKHLELMEMFIAVPVHYGQDRQPEVPPGLLFAVSLGSLRCHMQK